MIFATRYTRAFVHCAWYISCEDSCADDYGYTSRLNYAQCPRRFDGVHPDNTKCGRMVLYAIGLTPGPYIDRGQQSRVGTSQPQAFAFDVHAQTHACKLWSPGFGVRRNVGRRARGREKRRLEIQDGKRTPSHARQAFSWQSISLTSHL